MKVLVVYCHPNPQSFVAALRDRACQTLAECSHEVRLCDLYDDGFEPRLSRHEHGHHLDGPETKPDILPYVADLTWCEAIVLVYPTWWSGQPAMLKGWIDRVWVNGVAWDLPEGVNRLRPRLRNVRRLVAVTTHGSRKYVNTLEGEGGKRVVTRALRVLCHPLARTDWIAMYDLDNANDVQRSAFLDRVGRRLRKL